MWSQVGLRNKPSGGDEIPPELFQILKDDAVKVLQPICQQIWKTQQWSQDWKRSDFIPIPKKGNAKEFSIYCTIAFISHASKVMLKILQARLQQYVLPPPVSLASQSHHEKPPEVTCTSRGNQGFLPQPEKDLKRPSSTRLEARFPYCREPAYCILSAYCILHIECSTFHSIIFQDLE